MSKTTKRRNWQSAILAVVGFLVASAAVLTGCDRKITDRKIDVEFVAPATPAGLAARVGDRVVELAWDVAADAAQYYVYRADTTALDFALIDSVAVGAFTDRTVINSVQYFYRVVGVSADGLEGHTSPSASALPGVWSMVIDNNRPRTNNRNVTLSISAPRLAGLVKVAESPTFDDIPWQTLAGSLAFELSTGDGAKTVYARFTLPDGAETIDIVSDSIVLDTRAVIDSVIVSGIVMPRDLSPGDDVAFAVHTGEAEGTATIQLTGVSDPIALFDDGTSGDNVAGDGVYRRFWTIPPALELDEASVTARFTDLAGNAAAPLAADVQLTVQVPPDAVTELAARALSSTRIELEWFAIDAVDFQAYRIFRDETSNVSTASDLVATLTSIATSSYIDTGLTELTEYHYLIVSYDRTGLFTAAAPVAITTLENTAPEPVELAIPTAVDSTGLTLTWSRSLEDDFRFYRVFRSTTGALTGGVKVAVISTATQTSFTDSGLDLNTTTYYYWIVVVDEEGLESPPSDVVSHSP